VDNIATQADIWISINTFVKYVCVHRYALHVQDICIWAYICNIGNMHIRTIDICIEIVHVPIPRRCQKEYLIFLILVGFYRSKDNLQIGSVVASEHTDPQTEKDANMGFIMSTPISQKHLKNVSGNPSALTKQIGEHKRHMNESFSTGNVRTTSSKSIELLKASQLPADQVISPALIPPHTEGEADEAIQSLEQDHDLCDSVGSKKGTAGFVSSPAKGNHRYAAVDSAVSASQVLSEGSSCSTTAENSCESPSGSISSSFDADSCCIKSNESHLRSGRIVSLSKDCEGTQRDLNQYRRLTWEDSATSSTIGVASTPNQKNGWRKYATSVLPNDRRYAMDEDNIENSFLDAKHLSGRNIEASSKCIDSDALSPQQTKQVSMQSATTAHRELTPMACLKPQRIRNQPQSPVLTPVENEFQWKKLQEKGNQRMKSVDPVASSVTSWKSTDAAAAKTSLKTIDPTVPTKRDVLGSIDNNNIVSGTAAVVSVTASFSEWSKPVPMEDEEYRKRIQHDETFTKDSIAVDVSLSHWLNPTPPLSSVHDGGLGCTPRNGLPRPLPLPAIQPGGSPKFSQSERPILIQPSPMLGPNERPVSGKLSPKCRRQFERLNSGCFSGYRQLNNSATPKLHWDGLGIPNTTTKYNEVHHQGVFYFIKVGDGVHLS
jgi:hypothetical protein